MRKNGVLNFIIGDHLGSTSIVTDANGAVINETKYKAWGETRYSSGTEMTKYQYTGQYSYTSDFGLHFYNARWYDSSLSRFVQADTIVPSGVQGLDRYVYVNNSPLNYVDPSGHLAEDKVKKLLGLENLSEKEFKKWLKTNSALWNELLSAKVGDMISFMKEVDGENVYQNYIIGENEDGDYMFWGLNNQQQDNNCPFESCLTLPPPSYAQASQQEVLGHIQSGNEWGLYSLDPKSPINSYKYSLTGYSSGFISPGDITLENSQLWKQHGQERVIFSRNIGLVGGVGIVGGIAGCIGSFGAGCAVAAGAALWVALADTTISGPTYYPKYFHPYAP